MVKGLKGLEDYDCFKCLKQEQTQNKNELFYNLNT